MQGCQKAEMQVHYVGAISLRGKHYTDIDRDGNEISRFGGLPRELYNHKGKYNYLGTTDT